jgi:hypothetical protein
MHIKIRTNNNNNKALYISILISLLFLIPILLLPSFGPIDDYRLLNFQNLSFHENLIRQYNMFIGLKRFAPYAIIDQYLMYKIAPTAKFFYSVLFVLALSGMLSLYYIANKVISKTMIYVFVPFIFLSMVFTDNFYRLAPDEKYLILLIPMFLILFFKLLETGKLLFVWLSLILANIAIYSKEIIFVIFGCFSFIYIIILYFNRFKKDIIPYKKNLYVINIGIIISCFLFLLIYFILIYSKGNPNSFGFNNFYNIKLCSRVLLAVQIYKGYLFKVPIVTLYIPISLLIRIFLRRELQIYFQKYGKTYLLLFYDSLLISSWVYTIIVCLTGQGPFGRYLLPAVLFSFFPLFEYTSAFYILAKNKFHIIVPSVFIFCSLLNSSIRGLEWGLSFKLDEFSFQNSLNFIKEESLKRDNLKIYLADKEPYGNAEVFIGYGSFLNKQCNLKPEKCDLYSLKVYNRDLNNDWWSHNPKEIDYDLVNYSALQSLEFRQPQKGDFIVISANNNRKDTILNEISNLNIKVSKVKYKSQKIVYFPNPISLSVFRGKKPLLRKYTLYNEIYQVLN